MDHGGEVSNRYHARVEEELNAGGSRVLDQFDAALEVTS
jgi:hypothetical protein